MGSLARIDPILVKTPENFPPADPSEFNLDASFSAGPNDFVRCSIEKFFENIPFSIRGPSNGIFGWPIPIPPIIEPWPNIDPRNIPMFPPPGIPLICPNVCPATEPKPLKASPLINPPAPYLGIIPPFA